MVFYVFTISENKDMVHYSKQMLVMEDGQNIVEAVSQFSWPLNN